LSGGTQVRGQIKTEGAEAGFANAEQLAVKINLGDLASCLELDKNFFTGASGGEGECFSIPRASAPLDLFAAMARGRPIIESVGIVLRVRRRNRSPSRVVVGRGGRSGGISFEETPIRIEIYCNPFGGVKGGE